MKISVLNIDRHRSGICGPSFTAIIFRDMAEQGSVKLGIVFEAPGYAAVLDIAKLAECDIEFGVSAWHGDKYEPHLRRVIKKHLEA